MRVTADSAAIAFCVSTAARSSSGRTAAVCGPVADLEGSTEPPRGALDYQREETEGFLLVCHTSIRTRPDELVVTVLGRRRPHLRVDWNGFTFGY